MWEYWLQGALRPFARRDDRWEVFRGAIEAGGNERGRNEVDVALRNEN